MEANPPPIPTGKKKVYMVVSQNKGTPIFLIMGTPKKVPLVLGNLHIYKIIIVAINRHTSCRVMGEGFEVGPFARSWASKAVP